MEDNEQLIGKLLHFIDGAPTPWHAVDLIKKNLIEQQFCELKESEPWQLKKGGKYFVEREGASLCAFIVPKEELCSLHMVGAHTDSPCFKIKPNGSYQQNNATILSIEPYGAPLVNSWLNRDLAIAGKVIFLDGSDKLAQSLVCLAEEAIVLPQLAIHLDRKINEQGLQLNKQDHLIALAAIDEKYSGQSYLEKRLQKALPPMKLLLDADLFLYSIEPAKLVGINNSLIAAPRLDNLVGTKAAVEALVLAAKNFDKKDAMPLIALWNHEEIGSVSTQGAASPFISQIIERISLFFDESREKFFSLMANSLCLSVDLAHALHPGYQEKHEPYNKPLLGGGVVLKKSAQQRYAGSAEAMAKILHLCKQKGISFQNYVSRNDLPAGSTIGPIHAAASGMATVDIGIAELSMHSCRELCAKNDYLQLCLLLTHFLQN